MNYITTKQNYKTVFKICLCIFVLSISFLSCAYSKDKEFNFKINAEGVIAWGRGGGTDFLARTLISHVNANNADINIVPVNRTGFAGAYALQYAYNKKADGATILFSADNPPLYKFLGYGDKNYDDFECILLAGLEIVGIVVPYESPYKNFSDIVQAVKEGQEVIEASTNVGGMIWNMTNILNNFTHVHFTQEWYTDDKSAMEAVFAGKADFTFAKLQLVREAIRNGRVRYLSLISDRQIPYWEKTPLIIDEYPGMKDYLPFGSYYGVFVKKGTPPEILERLKKAFLDAYNSRAFQKYLRNNQMSALGLQGNEANKYLSDWSKRTLSALSKADLNMNFRFNSLEDL